MRASTLSFAVIAVFLISMSAAHGLAATSANDAEIHPKTVDATPEDANSYAEAQLVEGVVIYTLALASSVSVWAFQHPMLAKTVLVNLPTLFIGALTLYYGVLGVLVCYTAYKEYRAQRRTPVIHK